MWEYDTPTKKNTKYASFMNYRCTFGTKCDILCEKRSTVRQCLVKYADGLARNTFANGSTTKNIYKTKKKKTIDNCCN